MTAAPGPSQGDIRQSLPIGQHRRTPWGKVVEVVDYATFTDEVLLEPGVEASRFWWKATEVVQWPIEAQ